MQNYINGSNAKFLMKVDKDTQSIFVITYKRGGDPVVIHSDVFTDYPTTTVHVVMSNDAFYWLFYHEGTCSNIWCCINWLSNNESTVFFSLLSMTNQIQLDDLKDIAISIPDNTATDVWCQRNAFCQTMPWLLSTSTIWACHIKKNGNPSGTIYS